MCSMLCYGVPTPDEEAFSFCCYQCRLSLSHLPCSSSPLFVFYQYSDQSLAALLPLLLVSTCLCVRTCGLSTYLGGKMQLFRAYESSHAPDKFGSSQPRKCHLKKQHEPKSIYIFSSITATREPEFEKKKKKKSHVRWKEKALLDPPSPFAQEQTSWYTPSLTVMVTHGPQP